VYDVLETVDGSDLALATLVGATNDGDLVVLSDWDRADLGIMLEFPRRWMFCITNIVLLAKLLAQRCAHDGTSNAGWGIVMSLARLSPRGVEGCSKSVSCSNIASQLIQMFKGI
jgi:hypothetical protein